MEQTESRLLEMHASEIQSIFLKNSGFMTTKEIADIMQKAEWSKYELFKAALDAMIERGQLEFDSVYGYCRKGQKDALIQEMAKPSIARSAFDRLTPTEQAQHFKTGGRVVNG